MKNVDDALKILTDAIPGLLVKSYEKTSDDGFSMTSNFTERLAPFTD